MNGAKKIELLIDGMNAIINRGESLADAVSQLGVSGQTLNNMPLAAEIDGRVVSLSYKPLHSHELSLVRYGTDAGRRVYERSVKLILISAIRRLYKNPQIMERYSLGKGVYLIIDTDACDTSFNPLHEGDIQRIENECKRLVAENLPFRKMRLSLPKAVEVFTAQKQLDKAELMRFSRSDYCDVFCIDNEEYYECFFGELLPSTGYARLFRIVPTDDGIILLLPEQKQPDKCAEYSYPAKLAAVFSQSDDWSSLMSCSTVADLNKLILSGRIKETIRVNEVLHEKNYARLADDIAQRGARAIMVAGPSSSGKTTSANRLATHLRVHGLDPIMLSLDDYYIDRDKMQPDENGEYDLEHINTLDIEQFSHDLSRLIAGETVEVPLFDFEAQKRRPVGHVITPDKNRPFIIEGLHGLNPSMLTAEVDESLVYRLYISALNTLRIDDTNRIRTSDVRLLRRIVRDFATRNATADRTLSMWSSVRRGEETWIFPYQEKADTIFNTTLLYEIAVLKKYAYNMLCEVTTGKSYYATARELIAMLDFFVDIDVDIENDIPPTSILREFIGNNSYYN